MLNTKTKIFLTICLILVVAALSPNVLAASSKYIFEIKIPWFNTENINGFGDLINQIIKLSYRLAVLFVLYKIIEIGFKYMTGTGKAESMLSVAKGSKNLLIGVLILFGSYIILYAINPSLTQLPNNINCPPGSVFCDQKTTSKKTEIEISCKGKDPLDDESGNENDISLTYTTEMEGVTTRDISVFVSNNFDSIYRSGDWENAFSDLSSGKTSNNIWLAIKMAIENKDEWIDYTSCYGKIEPGPIFTGHEKAGDYISCHDTYEAVDFVVRDADLNSRSLQAKACMKLLMNYLRANMSDKIKVCDETMFEPPHIHVQDISCNVPCR